MAKINAESLADLKAMCGVSEAHCRKSLAAEDGNVQRAFRRLILEGTVKEKDLNPDIATAEDYALCVLHGMAERWSKLTAAQQKIISGTFGTSDSMREQFQGKVPITKAYLDIGILHRKVFLEKAHPELVDGKPRPTAELEPFPRLVLRDRWEGTDTYKRWMAFHARQGGTASSEAKARKGTTKLSVAAPGGGKTPPNKEQVAAYKFLKEHETEITNVLLGRIFAEYPRWREDFDLDEDEQEFMPAIKKITDLRNLIELETIHVLAEAKEGQAYIGFELRCTWDEEHGLGIMTHKGRIVKLGRADVSFLEWVATKDGGSRSGAGTG